MPLSLDRDDVVQKYMEPKSIFDEIGPVEPDPSDDEAFFNSLAPLDPIETPPNYALQSYDDEVEHMSLDFGLTPSFTDRCIESNDEKDSFDVDAIFRNMRLKARRKSDLLKSQGLTKSSVKLPTPVKRLAVAAVARSVQVSILLQLMRCLHRFQN